MKNILFRSAGFLAIIFLGFYLKKKKMCNKELGKTLAYIILNFTLPCSLINSFSRSKINSDLLIVLVLGLSTNFILLLLLFYLFKDTKENQAISMLNTAGYNIGTFVMPFIQSFFPASAVVYLCFFDIGNALMCLGGNYTIASISTKLDQNRDFKAMIKNLFSFVPFCIYIVLFLVSLLGIKIPDYMVQFTSVGAAAKVNKGNFHPSFNTRVIIKQCKW